MAATYGTFKYVPPTPDGDRRSYWAIAAQPHVMTRIKRVFPQLRQDRTRVALLADTPQSSRDLQWFMDRWPLSPADTASLTRLEARATGHRNTEDTVLRILEGQQPQYGWREPARPARAYQQQAADLVHATGRLLLADDLGLGKTFTSLLVLRNPAALPALVVTLTALPAQWFGELEKSLPWLRGHIVTSRTPYDPAARMPDNRDPDVLLMSYSKLAGWGDHLAGRIRCVIFDEMQELRRGDRAQKGIAGAAIADEATFRMGLTATPVYNYGDEIHTIVSILDRDALGTREEFTREWCRGADNSNGKIKVANPAALGAYLRDAGVMLRRTRTDVGRELPDVIRIEQAVDTDHERLRQLSGDAAEMARLVLTAADRQVRFQAAGKLDMRIRHATGVAKAPFVAGFVRLLLESEERVLLLGWHREVYDIWIDELREFYPTLYTGTESPAEKHRSVELFKAGTSRVLMMSLRSGAGLDGLQDYCNVLVFGELDWSPGVHGQAIGRLHRDGQSQPVLAYFMVSDDGSDPPMAEVLDLKRQQADPLVDPEADLFTPANTDGVDRIRALATDVLRRHGQAVAASPATPSTNGWSRPALVATATASSST